MKQAWHIFKKDMRYLRIELVAMVALAAALVWITPLGPSDAPFYYGLAISGTLFGWAALAYPAAMYFLIARVILAEAIPGTRQFWLTRPYAWKSLLIAKTLFVLIFAHAPLIGLQIAILQRSGFPLAPNLMGLFWSQLLTLLCVSIPAGVLAVLTPGMVAFTSAALVQLILISPRTSGAFGGVEWVRDALTLTLLVLLAIPIFVWQYRNRATNWSRGWTSAIVVAGLGIYIWMPWNLAFAIQSWGSRQVAAPQLRVSIDPADIRVVPLQNTSTQLEVDVPFNVANVPDLSSFRADALSVTFERSDGVEWTAAPRFQSQLNPYPQDSKLLYYLIAPVERTFLQGAGLQFTVKGELHFTVFAVRAIRGQQPRKRSNLLPDLQCEFAVSFDQCRTAFRAAAYVLETDFTNPEIPPNRYVSYSPFPARFAIHPLWGIGPIIFRGGPPAPDRLVTIKEPAAHLRQEFEIRGVRLADFTRE